MRRSVDASSDIFLRKLHCDEFVFFADVRNTLDTCRARRAAGDLVALARHAASAEAGCLSAFAIAPGIGHARGNTGAHAAMAAAAPSLCRCPRHYCARRTAMGCGEGRRGSRSAGPVRRQWLDRGTELERAPRGNVKC